MSALPSEPLRDSQDFGAWLSSYEQSLGVSQAALDLRRQALREGGASMLYRMLPQRFAQDLRGPYAKSAQLLEKPGPNLTLAGDAHLGNFGTLRDQDGPLLWTINDFDQTGPGRADYDLCRTGASLALVAGERGWDAEQTAELIDAFSRNYVRGVREFEDKSKESPSGLERDQARAPVAQLLKKAAQKTPEELLGKWCDLDNTGFRLRWSESLQKPDPSTRQRIDRLNEGLRWPAGSRVLDAGIRTDAGGSSLGLERYYLLVQSQDQKLPHLLELKQVLPSALLGDNSHPSQTDADNLRAGGKRLGAPKDRWTQVLSQNDNVYMLRERQPERDAFKLEKLSDQELLDVAKDAGQVLAQAHCHSGSLSRLDNWLDGNKQELSDALNRFSQTYAEQVRRDFRALQL